MNAKKKAALKIAMDYCEENDKSTEYMIQYMKDTAKASHGQVIKYLRKQWKTSKD